MLRGRTVLLFIPPCGEVVNELGLDSESQLVSSSGLIPHFTRLPPKMKGFSICTFNCRLFIFAREVNLAGTSYVKEILRTTANEASWYCMAEEMLVIPVAPNTGKGQRPLWLFQLHTSPSFLPNIPG